MRLNPKVYLDKKVIYLKNFNSFYSIIITHLPKAHNVIVVGGESIRNIFGQEKPLDFLHWINILLMPTGIHAHGLPVNQWWGYHLG